MREMPIVTRQSAVDEPGTDGHWSRGVLGGRVAGAGGYFLMRW